MDISEIEISGARLLCDLCKDPPAGMNFNDVVGAPETCESSANLQQTVTAKLNISDLRLG